MKKEVEEGNRLIAEFMGAGIEPYPDGHFPGETGYRFKEKMPLDAPDSTEGWWWNVNGLKFHSSWDWLMPAWVKFRDMKVPVESEEQYYQGYSQQLHRVSAAITHLLIKDAHEKLVEAIQWYNNYNNPKL